MGNIIGHDHSKDYSIKEFESGVVCIIGNEKGNEEYLLVRLTWESQEELEEVLVKGQWDNWQESIPLQKVVVDKQHYCYQTVLKLHSHSSYQYKFIINGVYTYDHHKFKTSDTFGSYNNVINL